MGRSGPTAESRESNSGQEDVPKVRRGDELAECNSGSRGLIAKGNTSHNGSALTNKKKNRLSLSYFKRDNAPKEFDLDQLISAHSMYGHHPMVDCNLTPRSSPGITDMALLEKIKEEYNRIVHVCSFERAHLGSNIRKKVNNSNAHWSSNLKMRD